MFILLLCFNYAFYSCVAVGKVVFAENPSCYFPLQKFPFQYCRFTPSPADCDYFSITVVYETQNAVAFVWCVILLTISNLNINWLPLTSTINCSSCSHTFLIHRVFCSACVFDPVLAL